MTRRLALSAVATSLLVATGSAVLASPSWADSIRSHEWMLTSLHVAVANHYSAGKDVTVAVIDSGVDGTHPDLTGRILQGIDLSDPDRPGGFGNGWTDVDGHGTIIASLIVGHGHGPSGSAGILGVAKGADILPIRDGIGDFAIGQTAAGVRWAIGHGASVICLAEGGPIDDPNLRGAIEQAIASNIVVVAGAGNAPVRPPVYPAAYPGVLAVAGVDQHGKHAAFSVDGGYVGIAAPATDIYSAHLHHGYYEGDGTSQATAIVAGAAALVRARFPGLSAVEVIHRLTATATDEGPPGRDDEYGYGDLNIVAALTADVPPLSPSPSLSPTATPAAEATSVRPAPLASERGGTGGFPYLAVGLTAVGVLIVLGAWTGMRRARR